MNNDDFDEIAAPREVIGFFSKIKCIVCGSELEYEDPHIFWSLGSYNSFADCKEDCFHYEISIYWKDPKKIRVEQEEVQFIFNSKFYKIKTITNHLAKSISNEITINSVDEDGELLLEDKELNFMIPGKIFNYKNYSPEKFANKINIMKVFA